MTHPRWLPTNSPSYGPPYFGPIHINSSFNTGGTPLSSLCSWAKYRMAKLQPNATTDHYHYITTFPVTAVGLLFVSLAPLVMVGMRVAYWDVSGAEHLGAVAGGSFFR